MNLGHVLASKGRFGDTMLAHISPEEADLLQAHGGAGTINPETGLPEYFKLGKLLRIAAPIALSFLAPGLGTAIGGALGASGAAASALGGGILGAGAGALGGGGLKGALLGGATGGVGGYLNGGGASQLFGGTQVGNALGLSNPESGSVFGNALGSTPGTSFSSGAHSLGGLLSNSGSSAIGSGFSDIPGIAENVSFGAPKALSGIGGGSASLGGNAALSSALQSGVGGGASSYSSGGGLSSLLGGSSGSSYGPALLGAVNSLNANDKAQKDLLNAQNNSMAVLKPYLASGTAANSKLSSLLGTGASGADPNQSAADILAASPGYQFQLDQGNQALDRQQAARGNFFSGAAIKAGQDYASGLANNTAQQYYGNLAQQAGQGQSAANSAGEIFGNTGNAKANAGISSSNIINQSLSSMLSGSGAKRPVNIGGQIYWM